MLRRQAKVGKEASSAERRPKSQKAAKQAKPAAGARESCKAAKVLGPLRLLDVLEGTCEVNRLATSFSPWILERHDCEEDEAQARLREKRRRRAPLLAEELIMPFRFRRKGTPLSA
jgi:hypothetical protein